jgi:hypothetical protein
VAIYSGHSLEIMGRYYANLIAEFQGRDVSATQEIQKARQERVAA